MLYNFRSPSASTQNRVRTRKVGSAAAQDPWGIADTRG